VSGALKHWNTGAGKRRAGCAHQAGRHVEPAPTEVEHWTRWVHEQGMDNSRIASNLGLYMSAMQVFKLPLEGYPEGIWPWVDVERYVRTVLIPTALAGQVERPDAFLTLQGLLEQALEEGDLCDIWCRFVHKGDERKSKLALRSGPLLDALYSLSTPQYVPSGKALKAAIKNGGHGELSFMAR
jgi:hypothetical protein